MREITDEALQRLYWASKQGQVFPGKLPSEANGPVTTNQILEGLGLVDSSKDDDMLPKPVVNEETSSQFQQHQRLIQQAAQRTPPLTPTTLTQHMPNSHSLSSYSTGSLSQTRKDSYSTAGSFYTSECSTPVEMDMCEQFNLEAVNTRPKHIAPKPVQHIQLPYRLDEPQQDDMQPFIDLDNFLDVGSSPLSGSNTMSQDLFWPQQLLPVHQTSDQSMFTMNDFLSPWPGTYAAAYSNLAQG